MDLFEDYEVSTMVSDVNVTTDNDGNRRTDYGAGVVFVLIVMVCIDITAVVGNVCVMAVIIRTPHLRSQLTYVFVFNLCVADLLCSLMVLPVAIGAYAVNSWPFGEAFCNASGFLSGTLTLTSISSICVISVERYYSIKMPMHYAANMTLRRTLYVIAYVWLQSAVIAVCPLLGWNLYKFRQNKAYCSYTWNTDALHRTYVIMLGIICFAIPSLVLVVTYCAIYRVAKKTASQIGPSRTISFISNGGISQFPFVNASRFLNGRCGGGVGGSDSGRGGEGDGNGAGGGDCLFRLSSPSPAIAVYLDYRSADLGNQVLRRHHHDVIDCSPATRGRCHLW